jgi:hypothetical protein
VSDQLTPDPDARVSAITGLRQLADYLDAHPDVPVTEYSWDLLAFAREKNDDHAARAEVDHVADLLDVDVQDHTPNGGHYIAARSFGRVTYEFLHIPACQRARHRAHMSYADNVIPDDTEAA